MKKIGHPELRLSHAQQRSSMPEALHDCWKQPSSTATASGGASLEFAVGPYMPLTPHMSPNSNISSLPYVLLPACRLLAA
jgi:hypothetical protein